MKRDRKIAIIKSNNKPLKRQKLTIEHIHQPLSIQLTHKCSHYLPEDSSKNFKSVRVNDRVDQTHEGLTK